jgi:hypothetical protein
MLTCGVILFIEFKAVPAILSFHLASPGFLVYFICRGGEKVVLV